MTAWIGWQILSVLVARNSRVPHGLARANPQPATHQSLHTIYAINNTIDHQQYCRIINTTTALYFLFAGQTRPKCRSVPCISTLVSGYAKTITYPTHGVLNPPISHRPVIKNSQTYQGRLRIAKSHGEVITDCSENQNPHYFVAPSGYRKRIDFFFKPLSIP